MKVEPLATGVLPDRFVGEPPVPVAVSVHAVAAEPPPLSLVTCLTSVSDGASSSLVMVQVFDWPSASATDPSEEQSPAITPEYPSWPVSLTVCAPALTELAAPLVTELPSMKSGKSATTALPPLSLMTIFVTVSDAPWSSLVIVQVSVSPLSTSTPVQFELVVV